MAGGDGLLPIINRPTPVMDRLRNKNGNSQSLASMLAKGVSQSQQMEQEEVEQGAMQFIEQFEAELASEFDVGKDAINDEYVESITTVLFLSERTDVLTEDAVEALEEVEDREEMAEQIDEADDDEEAEEGSPFSAT